MLDSVTSNSFLFSVFVKIPQRTWSWGLYLSPRCPARCPARTLRRRRWWCHQGWSSLQHVHPTVGKRGAGESGEQRGRSRREGDKQTSGFNVFHKDSGVQTSLKVSATFWLIGELYFSGDDSSFVSRANIWPTVTISVVYFMLAGSS